MQELIQQQSLEGRLKAPSFDAPTLFTESYHKNTAAARNIEALNNNFHDLKTVIFPFKKRSGQYQYYARDWDAYSSHHERRNTRHLGQELHHYRFK